MELKKIFISILCCAILYVGQLNAGDWVPAQPLKSNFLLGGGIGFGFSNDAREIGDGKILPGLTLSGTLGYRINNRFKIDFGPSLWIEAEDLFNNEIPVGERPKNKRMLVTFNGHYYPVKNCAFSIRLGAGIGTLVYSPMRNKITPEAKYADPTEIFTGPAGVTGISYEWKINKKFTFFPSLNFSYTSLQNQKIDYQTLVNPANGSFTSDLKFNLYFDF